MEHEYANCCVCGKWLIRAGRPEKVPGDRPRIEIAVQMEEALMREFEIHGSHLLVSDHTTISGYCTNRQCRLNRESQTVGCAFFKPSSRCSVILVGAPVIPFAPNKRFERLRQAVEKRVWTKLARESELARGFPFPTWWEAHDPRTYRE
jgi:hypothetical protein